jgi:ribosome-associated translation inhibitor RaiA
MEIIFHAHHASISPRLQQRAEQGIQKIVARLGRAVDGIVRFEEDGPTRRVEVILHAARGRRLVARGEGRYFGPALTAALNRLATRVGHVKGRRKTVARNRTGEVVPKERLARRLARA